MENASKALIIAGAILLSILIIAIGIFVFNGANSTITDSMTSMSTQEIEAFNNQFLSYDGKQSGSNVKALIGKLIANANTYKDEPNKVPWIKIDHDGANSKHELANLSVYYNTRDRDEAQYFNGLSNVRSAIENKHTYRIEINFESTGLIHEMVIYYK